MNQAAPRELVENRNRVQNTKTAAILHDLAACLEAMATAMDEEDEILGALSGEGVANNLAALPRHVREVFLDYASDEAHAGYLADQRYMQEMP